MVLEFCPDWSRNLWKSLNLQVDCPKIPHTTSGFGFDNYRSAARWNLDRRRFLNQDRLEIGVEVEFRRLRVCQLLLQYLGDLLVILDFIRFGCSQEPIGCAIDIPRDVRPFLVRPGKDNSLTTAQFNRIVDILARVDRNFWLSSFAIWFECDRVPHSIGRLIERCEFKLRFLSVRQLTLRVRYDKWDTIPDLDVQGFRGQAREQ